jgi:copper(I)-binding protein
MRLLPALMALLTSVLFSTAAFAHAGHEHDADVAVINVAHAQVREFLPGANSTVGYLTLTNHSEHAATLTKAALDGVGRVEIHQHSHIDGMMKMEKVDEITIAPNSNVTFQPGGYHLMIFEPQEPLKNGQERKLTLYFKDGNRVFTQANIVSLQALSSEKPAKDHDHSHH